MSLNLTEKFCVVAGVDFLPFACVLRGVLGNVGGWVWCFCGEFVVGCVANVDEKPTLQGIRKKGQGF
jgi:hypothetical protein